MHVRSLHGWLASRRSKVMMKVSHTPGLQSPLGGTVISPCGHSKGFRSPNTFVKEPPSFPGRGASWSGPQLHSLRKSSAGAKQAIPHKTKTQKVAGMLRSHLAGVHGTPGQPGRCKLWGGACFCGPDPGQESLFESKRTEAEGKVPGEKGRNEAGCWGRAQGRTAGGVFPRQARQSGRCSNSARKHREQSKRKTRKHWRTRLRRSESLHRAVTYLITGSYAHDSGGQRGARQNRGQRGGHGKNTEEHDASVVSVEKSGNSGNIVVMTIMKC